MKEFLILCSLTLLLAVPVPYDMDISWKVDGDSIVFLYAISKETHTTWGWSGMGIKNIEDGDKMPNGDYVSIAYEPCEFMDRHGVRNGSPKPDVDQGGEYSLTDTGLVGDDGLYVTYTWTRKLATGDSMDPQLEVGKDYYLQWAVGEYEAGVIKHHVDSGSLLITLTEDSVQETSFISILS